MSGQTAAESSELSTRGQDADPEQPACNFFPALTIEEYRDALALAVSDTRGSRLEKP